MSDRLRGGARAARVRPALRATAPAVRPGRLGARVAATHAAARTHTIPRATASVRSVVCTLFSSSFVSSSDDPEYSSFISSSEYSSCSFHTRRCESLPELLEAHSRNPRLLYTALNGRLPIDQLRIVCSPISTQFEDSSFVSLRLQIFIYCTHSIT